MIQYLFIGLKSGDKLKKEFKSVGVYSSLKDDRVFKIAQQVSEILEIEREIGTLRSDIESIEGRLNYLKDQVAMSTLNITFYKKVSQDSRFWSKVKSGFGNGWDFLLSIILGIINIWPVWIIACGLYLIIRRIKRKKV